MLLMSLVVKRHSLPPAFFILPLRHPSLPPPPRVRHHRPFLHFHQACTLQPGILIFSTTGFVTVGGAIAVDSFISGKRGRARVPEEHFTTANTVAPEQRGRRRFLRVPTLPFPPIIPCISKELENRLTMFQGGGLRARGNFCPRTSEWLIERERDGITKQRIFRFLLAVSRLYSRM